MRFKIQKLVAVVLIGATGVLAVPGAAHASADRCVSDKSDRLASCVDVRGTDRHVATIKSRMGIRAHIDPEEYCFRGHSQVLIGGQHYADTPDRRYCAESVVFGTQHQTGKFKIDKEFKRGTKICSIFWRYIGLTKDHETQYENAGKACIKVG